MPDIKISSYNPVSFKSKVEFATKESRELAPQIRRLINHIKHHTESNKHTYVIDAGKNFIDVDTFLYAERKNGVLHTYHRGVGQYGGNREDQINYVIKNIKALKEARQTYEIRVAQAKENAVSTKKNKPNRIINFFKSFIKNW